jgi:hypothetical protein
MCPHCRQKRMLVSSNQHLNPVSQGFEHAFHGRLSLGGGT